MKIIVQIPIKGVNPGEIILQPIECTNPFLYKGHWFCVRVDKTERHCSNAGKVVEGHAITHMVTGLFAIMSDTIDGAEKTMRDFGIRNYLTEEAITEKVNSAVNRNPEETAYLYQLCHINLFT